FHVLAAGTPEAYADWAAAYYERELDLDAVRHVFALRPLTEAVVKALAPEAEAGAVAGAMDGIGYPLVR
ncbi:hypothetical protein ACFXJJ_34645, partial [Streptomyces sp. NPDC059233]